MKKDPGTTATRKNFLLTGVAALFSAIGFKYFTASNKKTGAPVKMLTESGILVEIDQSIIASRGKRITNDELKSWIKKSSAK